jgi:hypothetical protein
MKKILLPVLLLFFAFSFSQQQRTIFGKVTDGKSPMSDVTVSVDKKDISTITDNEGKYKIEIETGDNVTFSYIGMKSILIKIEDITRVLNPIMIPDITELDEVVVAASKRRSQKDMKEDYAINKNIIRTAWGLIDAKRAAFQVRTLDEDEIKSIQLDLATLLSSKFPTVSKGPQGWVSLRGGLAIYDIDGQIFEPALITGDEITSAPHLDLGNIRRIGIISSLAGSATYGTLGKGGVVVINTFGGNPQSNKIVDRARLKNNFVEGNVLTASEIAKNKPSYLKELEASSDFEDAKEVYMTNKNKYSNSAYFFIDAYNYFYEDLEEEEFADTLIKDNFRLFEGNAVLLKALAYSYDSQERFKKSHELYKEVFILRPNYSQSFLDVANSYRNINSNKLAAGIYARYDYLIEENFIKADTTVFDKIIQREYNNLLALHKNEIMDSKKSKKVYVAEEDFKGTRLVFEWNDSEAEFDLQFVNPSNQYFKWKHSLADNSETIYKEKDFGFNTTEYLLDGALPGTWQVNVNYLGNKSLTPTFLKATVYYNYGTKNQRKEVKTFKLSLKNVNQELFKVTVGGKLVSR